MLYNQDNPSEVFNMRVRQGVVETGRITILSNNRNGKVFLEAGQHKFPFSLLLDAQNKKPPSFCIVDQNTLVDDKKTANKLTLVVQWTLRLKVYGKYRLDLLRQCINSKDKKQSGTRSQPKPELSDTHLIL